MPDQQPPPRRLTRPQKVQEDLYRFPYHFIPSWDGETFSQTLSLTWGYEYLSYLHFVLDGLGDIDFGSLLDVGCGDGRFLSEVQHRYPGRELAGVDYSRRAIQWARACSPGVKWLFGDITGPGTVNGTYDVVTLIETLEHIELAELPGFVDALRRCTTDDGKLFLTVPSKNVPVSGHHVQHFDVPTLTAILGKRFAIEQVVHLNRNAPAVKLVFRYLTSNRFFVIVHPRILTGLYTWYRKRFLIGTETDTKRIFLACRAV